MFDEPRVDQMRLPEQRLWDSFHSNIVNGVRLQRVENGLSSGMPDVVAIAKPRGIVTWVELKVNENPPLRDSSLALGQNKGLRTEQINWHLEWANYHGRSLILIGMGRGRTRSLHLIGGRLAAEVNEMSMERMREFSVTWLKLMDVIRGTA